MDIHEEAKKPIPTVTDPSRMVGTITQHMGRKNIGFIAGDDRTEYFLHAGLVSPHSPAAFHEMEVGDRIEFNPVRVLIKGHMRDRAANAVLVAKAGDYVAEHPPHE